MFALLTNAAFASDWQYTTSEGEGYSYDENGLYTDSRGYVAIGIEGQHTTVDNGNYSGKSYSVAATTSSNSDFVNTKMALPGEYFDSVFGIYNSTVKNSDFSNSSFVGDSLYDQAGMYVSQSASLENVNFTGTKFASLHRDNVSSAVRITGSLKNTNFSNCVFQSFGGLAANIEIYGSVESLNLSGITSEGTEKATAFYKEAGIDIKGATGTSIGFNNGGKNINLNNSHHNALTGMYVYGSVENLSAQNAFFENINDFDGTKGTIVSGGGTLKNADFRGAKMAYLSGTAGEITLDNVSDYTRLTNVMLSDGTIVSVNDPFDKTNLGLVLSDGEIFTLSKYENAVATLSGESSDIAAKITVDSTLTGGAVVLESGASLVVSEGVTLTLSDDVEFVLAEDIADISEALILNENATIVMDGYTDATATEAFTKLFKSQGGGNANFTAPETLNVKGNIPIPEPSMFGLLSGLGALTLVGMRRRKRR